jgi:hypothetical protein
MLCFFVVPRGYDFSIICAVLIRDYMSNIPHIQFRIFHVICTEAFTLCHQLFISFIWKHIGDFTIKNDNSAESFYGPLKFQFCNIMYSCLPPVALVINYTI